LLTMPIVLTSPANGQVLKYNGTSWVNDSDAGITGSGSAGQVAYFTGATTQAGEAGLTWDTTNKRLKLASTGGGQFYLEDTDATSTFNTTEITNNAGNFNIATRSSAGSFVSTDYQIVKDSASSTYHRWFTAASTERMRLFNTGNFGIGTGATDSGQRLQVIGDSLLRGSGATSGSNALVIQDSASVNIYTFRNDGQAISSIRNAQTEASLRFTQVTANNNGGTSIPIIWYENTAASQRAVMNGVWDGSNRAGFNFTHGQGTTGVSMLFNNPSNQGVGGFTFTINETFNPTSGTAFRVLANIAPTINQTGGANGITYGLYVNPTLTAAADWRSITWTNNSGWGLYGSGTVKNYLNGSLLIGSTTDSGEKLQVTGTAKITGASSFGGDLMVTRNSGSPVKITVNDGSNTTSTEAHILVNANSTQGYFSAFGPSRSTYKILSSGDVFIYKSGTAGDIALINDQSTGNIKFAAGGSSTTQMLLNASGNLGLGVTPSATSGGYINIQNGRATMMGSSSDASAYWNANATFNSGWKYIANGASSRYEQASGAHYWFTAASGTAGNAISYLQAMTLHLTGNLGLGTGSAADAGFKLDVNGTARITGATTITNNVTFGTLALGTGLYWNNTNNRLGIGMSLPESQLHVRNATGCVLTIESTNAGLIATPVETSINLTGYGATIQAQISSQDRQANITGGRLIFRVRDASNVLQDRFSIDRDGSATFNGAATIGLTSTTGYSLVVQNSGATDATGIRLTSGGTDNGYFITAYNSVSKYASLQAGDNTAYRSIVLNALGGNVGIGTNSVNASARFQVDSTTQGVLPPRMTTTQKVAIASPAAGLIVYDTTSNKLCCYNGTTWNDLF